MLKQINPKPKASFFVSVHPEVFYALQALSDPRQDAESVWRVDSLGRYPRSRWRIDLPGAFWSAVPDVIDIEPTSDIEVVVAELERVPQRMFQERFLAGLLHSEESVATLLDGRMTFQQVVASLPRSKREWLAHVGLYPLEPDAADALDRLLQTPQVFQADVAATVREFWEASFSQTWEQLLPAMRASVDEKQRLFEQCSFEEFLRHTLLPIELVDHGKVLRALRGGYELPIGQIDECIFIPSAFNEARFWTTYSDGALDTPWFPYCEPGLEPNLYGAEADDTAPAPDVALIFRALGNATRFAMASLIGRYPRSAVELASHLSVSKPTISHHLHILRSAGLVHEIDHKDSVLISLNKNVLHRLSDLAVARLLESREPLELTRSRRTS